MKLYEINEKILEFFETLPDGITEAEARQAWDALIIERAERIENLALLYKNYLAEAQAIEIEAKSLMTRAKQASKKAESVKSYLASQLRAGEKHKEAKYTLGWRRSESVEFSEGFVFDTLPQELKKVTIEPRKSDIKKAVKSGLEIKGVEIVEKNNLQIK